MKVRIHLEEEALGSSPNSEDIYRDYIGSKSPDASTIEDEVEALGIDAVAEKGMTVFPRTADGTPFTWDYQVRGFFKESFSALSKAGKAGYEGGAYCAKLKAFKKHVDQHLFVKPRKIEYHLPEGEKVGYCVRPLRADTPQGSRVALSKSETVPAGTWFEFEVITLMPELEPCVIEALEYGNLHGYGQWRNSGKGIFSYEILD